MTKTPDIMIKNHPSREQLEQIYDILDECFSVGRAVLKTGALGSVGTDPQYRALGLAHNILHAQTNYMKETDYDISLLLASKHAFYEKSGWRLVPQTAFAIKKPASRLI